MTEENNIFPASGDVLVYLAEPLHKKYSTTFIWGYPFSRYVSYDRIFKPLFWMIPTPFPQLRILSISQ